MLMKQHFTVIDHVYRCRNGFVVMHDITVPFANYILSERAHEVRACLCED
jgi:hypothetical protein